MSVIHLIGHHFMAQVIETCVLLLLTAVAARFANSALRRRMTALHIPLNVVVLVTHATWAFIWVAGLLSVLILLGFGLAPVIAELSVLTLGLTMAFQTLFQNLIAGVLILSEHNFDVGDDIEVVGNRGDVTDIRLRTTQLHHVATNPDGTTDDSIISIPNQTMFNSPVINHTRRHEHILPPHTHDATHHIRATADSVMRDGSSVVHDLLAHLWLLRK